MIGQTLLPTLIESAIPSVLASSFTLLVGFIAYLCKTKKDKSKSCIITSIALENFVDEFINIYFNNREYLSTMGNEGILNTTSPKFKTSEIKINWNSLSGHIIKEIFSVESRINTARRIIQRNYNPNYTHGDYEVDYIINITPIAIYALDLAQRLRKYGSLSRLEDFEELAKSLQNIEQDRIDIMRKQNNAL
ncbi:hypothetical protein DA2_3389 [Desulfovibrio sp. A2]|nr:hypothetical protein DA2_3389 [Desulfovibrio sp. A2]